MAQSVTEICNRALQLVGASQQILNLSDTTREARALTRAYDPSRRAELRKHVWNFAVRRKRLAASTDVPAFGPARTFPLPVDCVRVLVPRASGCDWAVEGRAIVASAAAPLDIRYIADIEDPTLFDPLFCEMLSLRIAMAIVEDISGSNTKEERLERDYRAAMVAARKVDAMEGLPQQAADSSWITARNAGASYVQTV